MRRNYCVLIAAVLALLIIAVVSASAQTFTFNGEDDATWRKDARNNNTGVFGLFTKGNGKDDRAYVKFSLPTIPVGYELVSADLLLYNYWGTPDGASVNYNVRIRGAEVDFSETSGSAPSGRDHEDWDIAVESFHVDSTPKLYTLDITSFFDQYAGKTVTMSIRAISGSGDGPIFVDKEGTNGQSIANRPRIKYTIAEIPPVPEPTSMMALALGFGALIARRRK